MHTVRPTQRESAEIVAFPVAAVLTALIPAAAAVSAAAFLHSVDNGIAVHRMIPILRAFGGMADQCRAAWRKLLQTDGLQRIALLAAGVVRVRTCYMSISKGFFAAPSSRLCAFVMWNGVLQRDGQYTVRHIELHLPDAADGQRGAFDNEGRSMPLLPHTLHADEGS